MQKEFKQINIIISLIPVLFNFLLKKDDSVTNNARIVIDQLKFFSDQIRQVSDIDDAYTIYRRGLELLSDRDFVVVLICAGSLSQYKKSVRFFEENNILDIAGNISMTSMGEWVIMFTRIIFLMNDFVESENKAAVVIRRMFEKQ